MVANEAIFKHGQPLFTDYTPGSAVLGGEIQVVGDLILIPHRDIAANEKAAVATFGGVYQVTADAAIAAGKLVYWNDSAGKVTETEGSNKVFGYSIEAASGDDDTFWCVHMPDLGVAGISGGGFLTPVIPTADQQALSDAGAVNVTSFYTAWTTTGPAAGTLADGTMVGQLKKVQLIVDAGDGTLTPANLNGGTTITFADAGDYALLLWDGSEWHPIELGNDADGATAPVLA